MYELENDIHTIETDNQIIKFIQANNKQNSSIKFTSCVRVIIQINDLCILQTR